MRKAFSVLEVVVTIMIVGIIAVIAKEVIPDTVLSKDTSYLFYKIKETQAKALLNEKKENCLTLDSEILNESSKGAKNNLFNKDTKIVILNNTLKDKKLCFDNEGKPFTKEDSKKKLIKNPLIVRVINKEEQKELVIMPFSGLVVIR
ncbi:MAG: prepilin-type N-terminal cleavage/methylation domain-containing protein [Epsilonproteobacteria bacterium]|nr:prepilin-type N-terminal cleavage/methylation domain-containing protein [Campylobacterota bacterium]